MNLLTRFRILVLISLLAPTVIQARHDAPAPDAQSPSTETVAAGGYTRVTLGIANSQYDLLNAVRRIQFSHAVHTVGQALEQLLGRSGYALATLPAADPHVATLLQQPLPAIHRTLGPARLEDLLKTLAGPAWWLVDDPVHRLISFDLNGRYRPCDWQDPVKNPCQVPEPADD